MLAMERQREAEKRGSVVEKFYEESYDNMGTWE